MGFLKDLIQKLRGKDSESRTRRLEKRVIELKSQAESLDKQAKKVTVKPIKSWYTLSERKDYNDVVRISFEPHKFREVVTMKRLQIIREEEERKRIERLRQKVDSALNKIDSLLDNEKADQASDLISRISSSVKELNDSAFNAKFSSCKKKLSEVRGLIRQKEIQRQIEEERRLQEELRRRQEEEERRRQAEIRRREQEEAERIRREREAREYEERLEREQEEQAKEKERLKSLVTRKKPDWNEFLTYLQLNRVNYFYHFTDKDNLQLIKRFGGLYSWKYCMDHDIRIPNPGGDSDSRRYDTKHGLQDYVHLSFCSDHPMAWRKKQEGSTLVLLRIKIDVAAFEGTLFSDINAADFSHTHGGSLDHLKKVNIRATKMHYVSRNDPCFKEHQAECMVKTFLPIEYIENIDHPDYI